MDLLLQAPMRFSLPADVLWGSFVKRTPKDVCGAATMRFWLAHFEISVGDVSVPLL